jgi:hypothetical protein
MEPLITFHILPVPKAGKVEICVWDRGHGELGSLGMPLPRGSAFDRTS